MYFNWHVLLLKCKTSKNGEDFCLFLNWNELDRIESNIIIKLAIFLHCGSGFSSYADFTSQRFAAALPSKSFFLVYVLLQVPGDKSAETFISVVLRNGRYCDI